MPAHHPRQSALPSCPLSKPVDKAILRKARIWSGSHPWIGLGALLLALMSSLSMKAQITAASSAAFPNIAVGLTSPSQNILLQVSGPLSITSIAAVASQGGPEYAVGTITGCAIDPTGNTVTAAGAVCTVPVTFSPLYPGQRWVPLQVSTIAGGVTTIYPIGLVGLGMSDFPNSSNPTLSTIAGDGVAGFAGNGGAATSAELYSPTGLVVDNAGNFYIADLGNNRIRKVNTSGVVSTFAGNGTPGFGGDGGVALNAELNGPQAIAIDSAGNIYIADSKNNRVRRVDVNGFITTVAGSGTAGFSGDGGAATTAELNGPQGIALDSAGDIFIADSQNNRVRRVDVHGLISTVAGNGAAGFSGDTGAATSAELNVPVGVAVDVVGNLFIADALNNRVRKVSTAGAITTLAGSGIAGFSGDGAAATLAKIDYPSGVAVDSGGGVYFADLENFRVRKIDTSGLISTVAGTGVAATSSPYGIALDGQGSLYIADSTNSVVQIKTVNQTVEITFPTPTPDFSPDTTDGWISNRIFNAGNVAWNGGVFISQFGYTYNPFSAGDTADPQDCSVIAPLAPGESCDLNFYFYPATYMSGIGGEGLLVYNNETAACGPPNCGYNFAISATGILPPVVIQPSTLPAATVGTAYSQVITSQPSNGPGNTYSATGLPPGLTLQSLPGGETLAGTPTQGGTFPLVISAYDPGDYHQGPPLSGSASYTFIVNGMPTSTSLTVTAPGSSNSSVAAGSVVTLTASVNSGTGPLTPGMVKFCDTTTTTCMGTHLLGTAQLTSTGVATFRFVPGIGNHSYQALFVGTHNAASSASTALSLNVTESNPLSSITTIAQGGSAGDYSLTATVAASLTPSGSVSFLDTSSGDAIVTTGTLPTGPAGVSFLNSSNPAVGKYPRCIAVADFNQDGFEDVAVGNYVDGTIEILFGDGHGNFTPSAKGTIGVSYPNSIATADINGDGIPDLAIATFGGSAGEPGVAGVTTLIGDGSGGFTASSGYYGNGTYSVAIADFTGNGVPSVVATNYYQNGDGTGGGQTGIATGDFNGDGIQDMVIANSQANTVSVIVSNSSGGFTPLAPIATGNAPVSIAVSDFNGDGILDLAVANISSNFLTILLGNGDGTFKATPTNPPSSTDNFSIAAGDFNLDGKQDLVVSGGPTGPTVLLGDGTGGFMATAPITLSAGGGEAVAVGDFNGDGIQDIVSASGNSISTLLSQLTQTVAVNQVSPIGTGVHQIEASYSGDSQLSGSSSNTTALSTQPVPTSLTLAASPVSSQFGQQVSLVANLSPFQDEGLNATGLVTFYSGTQTLGIGNLIGGTATLTTSSLPVGGDSLTATYGGNSNFAGSTSSTVFFVVSGTKPTISFAVPNTTYGVAPFNVAATSNSTGAFTYSAVSGPATVSGSTVTITGAGTVILEALQAASGNYGSGSQTATFTVAPEAPTITFNVTGQTYGATPFSIAATSNSPGAFTYSVVSGPATVSGATVTLIGVGTVVLQASQVASANYATGSQTASFTVAAEAPTIAFSVPNQTYGIAPFVVAAISNSTGAIAYSVTSGPATVSGSIVAISGTGTVVLKASQAAAGNYAAGSQTATFTVTPAVPTITFSVPSQVYGNAPFTVAATSNSTGAFNYSVVSGPATVAGATVTLTGSGIVVLKASQLAAGNYTSGSQTATFTVAAAAPSISFVVADQSYGAAPFTITATSNSTGTFSYSVVSGPATVSGATVTLTGVGTVVLKASQVAAGNYTAGSQTASFTVAAEAPTITFSVPNQTYGVAPFTVAATSNSTGAFVYSVVSGPATISGATVTLTGSGTVVLKASEAAAGNYTAGAQTATFTVATGDAPTVSLSPASLTFTYTKVGSVSANQNVTVMNTGNATLNISSVTAAGTDASSFYVPSRTCGATLAAGASCTLSVGFRPKASGTLTGSISIADNAGNSPQTIAVSGTGVASPVVKFSMGTLTFPSTDVGATSASQAVTLTNTGDATLSINYLISKGTDPASFFDPSNTCGKSVAAGASCTINIAFRPKSPGALTDTIYVNDNAAGGEQGVNVSGTGIAEPLVTLTPNTLTFPNTTVGTTSTAQTVTLKNTGFAVLDISYFSTTGTDASSFSVPSRTCGSTLAVNASCTFNVTFKPQATGALTGNVTIHDNAVNSPQGLKVSGIGK